MAEVATALVRGRAGAWLTLIWHPVDTPGQRRQRHTPKGRRLILMGDAVHNAVDGVVIAAGFLTAPPLGVATAIAVIAHEVPQEVGDFAILLDSGDGRTKALVLNALFTAVTLPAASHRRGDRCAGVPERPMHINAGSELILRQLFTRFGQQAHRLTPPSACLPEIARRSTETRLLPAQDVAVALSELTIPEGTTVTVIVNPNHSTGGVFDMRPGPDLLRRYPQTRLLVDEAFIGLAGRSVVPWVPAHPNRLVTRTLSKAHSLAGVRGGDAVLPAPVADDLPPPHAASPLARPSEAAAIATLQHEDQIQGRVSPWRAWTQDLAAGLRALGVRTFPTETYCFLADCAPHDAGAIAVRLTARHILVKPRNDKRLGPGDLRVATALPEDNAHVLVALWDWR